MKAKSIVLFSMVLLLSGCAILENPRARYVAAEDTITATCNVLLIRSKANKLSEKDKQTVRELVPQVKALMDEWNVKLLAGEDTAMVEKSVNEMKEILEAIEAKGGG